MTPEQAIRQGIIEEDMRVNARLLKQKQTLDSALHSANEELKAALDVDQQLREQLLQLDDKIRELVKVKDKVAGQYDRAHTLVNTIRRQVAQYQSDLRDIRNRLGQQPKHHDKRLSAYEEKLNGSGLHTKA